MYYKWEINFSFGANAPSFIVWGILGTLLLDLFKGSGA